ncbi:MAG: PAS domain S-box protein, partial [Chloroflexales bacterium]|nr:PAS domain S-box protein [Chloroflexales bacterium]
MHQYDKQVARPDEYATNDGADGTLVNIDLRDELTALRQRVAALKQENLALTQQVAEQAAALAQSQIILQSIIDNAVDFIFVKDLQGRFLLANQQCKAMFDLDMAQIVGKTNDDLFIAELAASWNAKDQQVITTGETLQVKESLVIARGQCIYTMKLFPIYNAQQTMIAIGGIARDITKQKEEQEAHRTLVERSLQGLVIYQDDRIVFANPMISTISGYSLDELHAMSQNDINKMVLPEDREWLWSNLHNRLAGKDIPAHYEYRFINRDGKTGWLELFASMISYRGRPAVQAAYLNVTERKVQEERLRLLESVIVHTNDAVIITEARPIDEPGPQILYVNQAFERMTGYSAAEIIGKTPRLLQGPQTSRVALAQIRQALEQCQPTRVEVVNYRKDGSTFWIELDISPITDADGKGTHWVAIQRDITDRKLMEEALRASEERFRTVWESAADAMALSDSDGIILLVNPAYCQLYGFAMDNVVGRHFAQIFPEEHRRKIAQDYIQVFQHASPGQLFESQTQRKDGTILIVESRIDFLRSGNERIAMLSSIRDITERKQMERTIRESRALLYSIVDNAPAVICAGGSDGRFTLVNKLFVSRLGLDHPRQVIGKTIDDFFTPELRAQTDRDNQQVLATGETLQREDIYVQDGVRQTWLSSKFPIYDRNRNITAIGVITIDITQQKEIEAALRATTSRLITLIESLNAGILVEDETRRIALVNQTFCQIFGIPIPSHDMIGVDCIQAAETAKNLFVNSDHFTQRIAQIINEAHPVIAEELQLVDGRTFERDYIPIVIDNEESGHLWQYRDITRRKQIEESLRRYAERLQALHEIEQAVLSAQSPVAIAQAALRHLHQLIPFPSISVAEFDLRTRQGWPLAVQHNGQPSEPLMGRFPITHFKKELQILQRGEISISDDLSIFNFPDAVMQRFQEMGVRIHVAVPLFFQNQLVGSLNLGLETLDTLTEDNTAIVREVASSLAIAIRQSHLYEQTRRDAETKATLLHEVNHRVKNNLSAIIGLLYAEQRRSGMERQPLYQAIINELVSRVQSLAAVHSLLSATAWHSIKLSELAHQIIHLAVRVIPHNIPVVIDVSDSSITVSPDQAHNLALVINELATNTVKYALPDQHGSVRIFVRITLVDQEIRLEFRDNGIGYPREVLQHDQQH